MFKGLIESVPGELEIIASGHLHTVTIPLAASADGLSWAAAEIRLISKSWCGVAVHELKFLILVFDAEADEPEEIYDRYKASPYVGPVRELVLPCVCAAARALIEAVQPSVIYRATFATRHTDKSLEKHQIITDTIEKLGYGSATEGTDGYNRKFWVMVRDGDEDGEA